MQAARVNQDERLRQALQLIRKTLDDLAHPILRQRDVRALLERHRGEWGLAVSTTLSRFMEFLVAKKKLRRIQIKLRDRPETLYVWGTVSPLLIANSVKPKAYLCHQTAMVLHKLIDREEPTIFVNAEQRTQFSWGDPLLQSAIDAAFRRQQRVTKNRARLGKHWLCLLNGKNTSNLGVIRMPDSDGRSLQVTGLERTLIDIAVRPAYAGGPAKVLQAFRLAYGRFEVAALHEMLKRMDFVYPYDQAIGFYLDRAGVYASSDIEKFRSRTFTHDFYLAYAMKHRVYSAEWRMHVPSDL